MAEKIITPEATLSFPNLFVPRAYKNKDPKYGASLVFLQGTDLTALKRGVLAVLEDRYGAKYKDMVQKKQLKLPFRDGVEKDYPEGSIFINVTSVQRPGLVDRNVKPIIDQSELYAGCIVRASVNPFTYEAEGNKGASFGLLNMQKIRDGDRWDGRSRAEDDFGAIGGDDLSAGSGAKSDDELLAELLG